MVCRKRGKLYEVVPGSGSTAVLFRWYVQSCYVVLCSAGMACRTDTMYGRAAKLCSPDDFVYH